MRSSSHKSAAGPLAVRGWYQLRRRGGAHHVRPCPLTAAVRRTRAPGPNAQHSALPLAACGPLPSDILRRELLAPRRRLMSHTAT